MAWHNILFVRGWIAIPLCDMKGESVGKTGSWSSPNYNGSNVGKRPDRQVLRNPVIRRGTDQVSLPSRETSASVFRFLV
jgi:hypothetical protein